MKDLYRAVGAKPDAPSSISAGIRMAAASGVDAQTLRAAKHVLLVDRRKEAYDHYVALMHQIGRLRATYSLAETPLWVESRNDDFAASDFAPMPVLGAPLVSPPAPGGIRPGQPADESRTPIAPRMTGRIQREPGKRRGTRWLIATLLILATAVWLVVVIKLRIDADDPSQPARPSLIALKLPSTGFLQAAAATRPADRGNLVLVVKPRAGHCYFVISDKQEKILATVFVGQGEKFTVPLRRGEYLLQVWSGNVWFGEANRFGTAAPNMQAAVNLAEDKQFEIGPAEPESTRPTSRP